MNSDELLAEIRQVGLTVSLTADGRLRLTGPAAALTPELQAALIAGRDELVACLADAGRPPEATESRPAPTRWLIGAGTALAVLVAACVAARSATLPRSAPSVARARWPVNGRPRASSGNPGTGNEDETGRPGLVRSASRPSAGRQETPQPNDAPAPCGADRTRRRGPMFRRRHRRGWELC